MSEEVAEQPTTKTFVLPGVTTILQTEDDAKPIGEVLAMLFAIASSNPDAKVDFWMKLKAE